MSNMHPLVSVYIPTHNRPDFLERALSSLERQTYKHIEVLVCDDASECDLSAIRTRFESSFHSLRWLRNDEPLGACASRNRLIWLASGEYITGLDDDDEFLPTRLENLLRHPMLNSYSYLCSSNIVDTGKLRYRGSRYSGVIDSGNLIFGNLVGNQVFTRTEYLKRIGGFDESFPAWQDYDAWFRLTKDVGPGLKIKTPTYVLNVGHEIGRISTSSKAKLGYERFVEKHKLYLSDRARNSLNIEDKINRNQPLTIDDFRCRLPLKVYKKVFTFFIKKLLINK